jgi:hypothetical protein
MSQATYSYNLWNKAKFDRENGHIFIWASVFSSSDKFSRIFFLLDTGAYISVLSRDTAERIGLQLTGKYTANLIGFNKEREFDKAEVVVVPKMEIGKYAIENVQILVPLEDITVPEILGENVLEYFIYTVDHEIDHVFFAKNPNPKPYINLEKGIDLSCGQVLVQEAI